jgi:hypothetical protein
LQASVVAPPTAKSVLDPIPFIREKLNSALKGVVVPPPPMKSTASTPVVASTASRPVVVPPPVIASTVPTPVVASTASTPVDASTGSRVPPPWDKTSACYDKFLLPPFPPMPPALLPVPSTTPRSFGPPQSASTATSSDWHSTTASKAKSVGPNPDPRLQPPSKKARSPLEPPTIEEFRRQRLHHTEGDPNSEWYNVMNPCVSSFHEPVYIICMNPCILFA